MRAIFKGTNGSAGFRTGTEYFITSLVRGNEIIITSEHTRVPYATVESFLRNWDVQPEVDPNKVEPKVITRVLNTKNIYEVSMATGLDQALLKQMHKKAIKEGDWIEVIYTKGVPGSTVLKDGNGKEIGLE